MTTLESAVQEHYGGDALAERVLAAAAQAGVTEITPVALSPADEFHTGGLGATRELAQLANLQPGQSVIDLGCGIGGPARILASEFGATVTGIDLTPAFVTAAETLTERCGMSGNPSFRACSALDLPFEDDSFDLAWTQHVVMNIADRETFYREAARVLKPGGKLAFFDILQGPAGPVHFPVPWAPTPDISHLRTPDETRAAIAAAGLAEVEWRDVTQRFIEWFRQMRAAQEGAAPSPLGLHLVIGPDIMARAGNVTKSAEEGRVLFVQGVFRKA